MYIDLLSLSEESIEGIVTPSLPYIRFWNLNYVTQIDELNLTSRKKLLVNFKQGKLKQKKGSF